MPSYIKPTAAPTIPTHTRPNGPSYPVYDAPVYHPDAAGGGSYTNVGGVYAPGGVWQSDTGPVKVPGAAQTTSPFDTDPGYAAARAAEQLGIPSINTNLQNLIAQRLVAYGDPSFAAQADFGLDPQAAAFARQNYLSGNAQLARIDKGHSAARTAIINQLASHGLIDSGETGYQVGNADRSYGNQVYDAQQSVLADILGYRNNAQTQLTGLHGATVAALENAFTNYATNPAAYGQLPNPPAATTPAKPAIPATPATAAHRAVVKQLMNPYTTGRKRFG